MKQEVKSLIVENNIGDIYNKNNMSSIYSIVYKKVETTISNILKSIEYKEYKEYKKLIIFLMFILYKTTKNGENNLYTTV